MFPFPIGHWGGGNAIKMASGGAMKRNADLVGNANGKKIIQSAWIKTATPPEGSAAFIYTNNAGPSNVFAFGTDNKFRVHFVNSVGADRLKVETASTYSDDAWHHVLFSADMAVPGSAHMIIDDVEDTNVLTFIDDTLAFIATVHRIGVGSDTACLTEVYINRAEYLDVSIEANKRKFITADKKPADLGNDGSTPTGFQPIMYFRGSASEFKINRGSGGAFTDGPSLIDCSKELVGV